MNNILYLDCETTGFKDKRLVQLAYKHDDQAFEALYNPERLIDFDAMAVHHITNEMVADKPKFVGSEDQNDLRKLLNEKTVVCHNSAFDVGVLAIEGLEPSSVICTYKCAKALLDPEGYTGRHTLQILRYALKLEIPEGTKAHDAMGDVIVLEALFKHLLPLARGGTTEEKIQNMIEISRKAK